MNVKLDKISKNLTEAIKSTTAKGTQPYDTPATVTRIEGDTAWVHISGGVDETPVAKTINCNKGDTVQIRVSGGNAWITGNATAPPTDDAKANIAYNYAETAIYDAERAKQSADNAEQQAVRAKQSADRAEASATSALTSAQNAQQSADSALVSLATVEDVVGVLNWITAHGTMTANGSTPLDPSKVYFIVDSNGDYEVGGTRYSIVSEPKAEERTSYYTLSVDESVQNYVATHIVVNTEGLWLIPDSGGNKVLIATGAGSSYTTAGTYVIGKVNNVDTVFAKFTQSGATMTTKDSSGNVVEIANLGYGIGNDGSGGTATQPYYTFGVRSGAIGNYSVAEGYDTTASGAWSHAEGDETTASGASSHAEGDDTTASGSWSHAEGNQTTSTNRATHAEGFNTTASGDYGAHAEGYITTASGSYGAHTEGSYTEASGNYSHSEGDYSKATEWSAHAEGTHSEANGKWSHSQNRYTIANGDDQTALGKFNIADTTNAVIIGNGTASTARSNALTVDWNGNVNIASGAKYKINGNNLSASDIGLGNVNNTSDANKPISTATQTALNGKVSKTGDTMTGQLLTSFNSSVAMGSYGSTQTTVDGLVGEVRFSSGCMGSASINTAYTSGTITIPTGWYNFIYTPHRSGGANGSASGDNANYGNLFLLGMNNTNGQYLIRVSSSAIAEVIKLQTSNDKYVKAQGSITGAKGTWVYRAWSDGFAEVWYMGSITFSSAGSSYQGWYRSTQNVKIADAVRNITGNFADTSTVIVTGAYNGHPYTSGGIKSNGTYFEAQVLGMNALSANTTTTNWSVYISGYKRS